MESVNFIQERQHKANIAVRDLRKLKLAQGQVFMINSRSLPQGECYLEYPDGNIRLATISSSKIDFSIIRDLSAAEVSIIRNQFQLY